MVAPAAVYLQSAVHAQPVHAQLQQTVPRAANQWCSIRQSSTKKITTPVMAATTMTILMNQFCSMAFTAFS